MIFYNISKGANMTFRTEASLASKILKFSSILMMTLLISDMSAKHMNKCSLQMTLAVWVHVRGREEKALFTGHTHPRNPQSLRAIDTSVHAKTPRRTAVQH